MVLKGADKLIENFRITRLERDENKRPSLDIVIT